MPADRPHRRLSLTQPTTAAPAPPVAGPEAAAPTLPASGEVPQIAPAEPVRVMVYFEPDEAQALDDAWVRLRRLPGKPSKSDLIRAAVSLALNGHGQQLTEALTQQRSSTSARQKARR